VSAPVLLADLTTLGLGGPARELVTATSAADLVTVMDSYRKQHEQVLVLGGGSNLVVADEGVAGPVVRIAIPGIELRAHDGLIDVTIGAGENWDAAVDYLIEAGLTGLAALSGIPGSAGATPVQNVGAYGTEIADMLQCVTLYHRRTGVIAVTPAADLAFGYRSSALRGTDIAVVTDVTLRLGAGPTIVRYVELAKALGIEPGQSAPETDIRQAVLSLRRSKGMVIEAGVEDPDTRSVGSFFTNPILDRGQLDRAEQAIRAKFGPATHYPSYPAGDGRQKLSAAWLIERAGFAKGFDGPGGRVGLSSKHTLALINRNGTTRDLLCLARTIIDGVRQEFEVDLHVEPVFVGVSL